MSQATVEELMEELYALVEKAVKLPDVYKRQVIPVVVQHCLSVL